MWKKCHPNLKCIIPAKQPKLPTMHSYADRVRGWLARGKTGVEAPGAGEGPLAFWHTMGGGAWPGGGTRGRAFDDVKRAESEPKRKREFPFE